MEPADLFTLSSRISGINIKSDAIGQSTIEVEFQDSLIGLSKQEWENFPAKN